MKIELINGDCLNELPKIDMKNCVIVTDTPFNVGCHYSSYKDNIPEDEYYEWLSNVLTMSDKFVCIHYPENLYKLLFNIGVFPTRIVSWVYNSNTAKQHRDIAFVGVKPDFNLVRQPYKNPNDKRIRERIAKGCKGGRLYDWWNINQIKNVQKKNISHPCVMPVEVMKNIIGILPKDLTVVDPFMGSGQTGMACIELQRNFIGIEIDVDYFNLAKERIELSKRKGIQNCK